MSTCLPRESYWWVQRMTYGKVTGFFHRCQDVRSNPPLFIYLVQYPIVPSIIIIRCTFLGSPKTLSVHFHLWVLLVVIKQLFGFLQLLVRCKKCPIYKWYLMNNPRDTHTHTHSLHLPDISHIDEMTQTTQVCRLGIARLAFKKKHS